MPVLAKTSELQKYNFDKFKVKGHIIYKDCILAHRLGYASVLSASLLREFGITAYGGIYDSHKIYPYKPGLLRNVNAVQLNFNLGRFIYMIKENFPDNKLKLVDYMAANNSYFPYPYEIELNKELFALTSESTKMTQSLLTAVKELYSIMPEEYDWISDDYELSTPLICQGVKYKTVSHYMAAMKSNDFNVRKHISTLSVNKLNAYWDVFWREIRKDWSIINNTYLYKALHYKAQQDNVKNKLLNSFPAFLVNFVDAEFPKNSEISKVNLRGMNLTGRYLMDIRKKMLLRDYNKPPF